MASESRSAGWFMADGLLSDDGLEIDPDKCRDCTTWYSGPHAAVGSRDGLNRSGGLCKEGGSVRAALEPGSGRRCRRIGSKQLTFPRLRRLLAGLPWFFVQLPGALRLV